MGPGDLGQFLFSLHTGDDWESSLGNTEGLRHTDKYWGPWRTIGLVGPSPRVEREPGTWDRAEGQGSSPTSDHSVKTGRVASLPNPQEQCKRLEEHEELDVPDKRTTSRHRSS